MFYSHEILTQRKYGVATIWLVATLGLSKTVIKKVGRKEILSVDIPKACTTVVNPEAPLALRLQSGLLIGITRVYYQQCEYFFRDVTHAHSNVVRFAVTKGADLDLARGGEARAEQLILADDPAIHPEMLELDLADLELDLEALKKAELEVDFATSQLLGSLPPSWRSEPSSFAGPPFSPFEEAPTPGSIPLAELEDLGFEFNELGEIREASPELPPPLPLEEAPPAPSPAAPRSPARIEPVSEEIEARVRAEHAERPEGEEIVTEGVPPEFVEPIQAEYPAVAPSPVPEEVEEAPARPRAPRRKGPIQDTTIGISGPVMKAWQRDYLKNMEMAKEGKDIREAKRVATVNARVWVLEHGFTGPLLNPELKELFSGQAFYDRFAVEQPEGEEAVRAKRRLERSPSEELREEERRVRPRAEIEVREELGRGMAPPAPPSEIELGREAPAPPEELVSLPPSEIPWGELGGVPSSSVGIPSVPASPIQPRGVRAVSRLSVAEYLPEVVEEGPLEETFPELERPEERPFEFFRPEPELEAEREEIMERESLAFYELVKQKISDERARREEELEEVPVDFTIFQDIIKPGVDTRPTAAKHFYHLLVLATKNMLAVSQEEQPYGPIQISVL